MRVVIAGGTGFLGRALVSSLAAAGHDVAVLTRRPRPGRREIAWTPDGSTGPWAASLTGVDAIVNLAGEGIADRRWTASRKRALVESRVMATSSLVEATLGLARPPRVFVSGSGVGLYGPRGDEEVTEATRAGDDFVATMAVAWEQAAAPVAEACRLAIVRTAMVLGPGGGALARMLLPFKLGVGGRLGSGQQWMPWIHVTDWVALVERLMADDAATGAFNLASPEPVRNVEFTKALGRVLNRPTVLPVPAAALSWPWGSCRTSCSPVSERCRRAPPSWASRSATRASTTPSPPRSESI